MPGAGCGGYKFMGLWVYGFIGMQAAQTADCGLVAGCCVKAIEFSYRDEVWFIDIETANETVIELGYEVIGLLGY